AAFEDDVHHPGGGATEGEGVTRAGGDFANGETADQGIELVGNGDDTADGIPRNLVVEAGGAVVIVNGVSDDFGFALLASVEPAHYALQFREFSNHFSDKVALTQLRDAVCIVGSRIRIGTEEGGAGNAQLAEEPTQAGNLQGVRTERGFVGDGVELG